MSTFLIVVSSTYSCLSHSIPNYTLDSAVGSPSELVLTEFAPDVMSGDILFPQNELHNKRKSGFKALGNYISLICILPLEHSSNCNNCSLETLGVVQHFHLSEAGGRCVNHCVKSAFPTAALAATPAAAIALLRSFTKCSTMSPSE